MHVHRRALYRGLVFVFTERSSLKAERGELPLSKRRTETWDLTAGNPHQLALSSDWIQTGTVICIYIHWFKTCIRLVRLNQHCHVWKSAFNLFYVMKIIRNKMSCCRLLVQMNVSIELTKEATMLTWCDSKTAWWEGWKRTAWNTYSEPENFICTHWSYKYCVCIQSLIQYLIPLCHRAPLFDQN